MTNDEVRELWKYSNCDYNTMFDNIAVLQNNLTKKFEEHNKINDHKLFLSSRFNYYFTDNTRIISDMYLFVSGTYYIDRECISFNKDGFIGFAGWASSENTAPILEAFIETLSFITKQSIAELLNRELN